jgi:hypothetical protein
MIECVAYLCFTNWTMASGMGGPSRRGALRGRGNSALAVAFAPKAPCALWAAAKTDSRFDPERSLVQPHVYVRCCSLRDLPDWLASRRAERLGSKLDI